MILLDYSSIAMSSLMVQLDHYDDEPDMIRHMIFNILRKWNSLHREEYGEMVICFDSKNNWRREVFPEYKASRRKGRKNSVHDWDTIFKRLDEVHQEVKEYGPYRTIQVERCEADDIIGTLCEKHMTPDPILIISPDTDFIQLQRYPNVKQFSNLQKKWLVPKVDAVYDLEEKVLRGDTGDGVPNVMSDDNVLIEENLRQTPLNKRKLAALMEDRVLVEASPYAWQFTDASECPSRSWSCYFQPVTNCKDPGRAGSVNTLASTSRVVHGGQKEAVAKVKF